MWRARERQTLGRLAALLVDGDGAADVHPLRRERALALFATSSAPWAYDLAIDGAWGPDRWDALADRCAAALAAAEDPDDAPPA